MAETPVKSNYHTVTPYLINREAEQVIEFVKQAFDGKELFRGIGSAGGIHAEVQIGDSIVMIGGTVQSEPMPETLYLYIDDVDTTYKRALSAGAASIMEPADQSFGDRLAGVKDLAGNIWYIAAPIKS